MRAISLLFILFLTSCSIFVTPRPIVEDSPYDYEEVDRALIDFSNLWFDTFDEDIWWTIEDIHIQFYAKEEYKNGCITGLTSNPGKIRVSYLEDDPQELKKTSIWHELTHSTLWYVWKDPDGDHSNGDGPWTKKHDSLISELKK